MFDPPDLPLPPLPDDPPELDLPDPIDWPEPPEPPDVFPLPDPIDDIPYPDPIDEPDPIFEPSLFPGESLDDFPPPPILPPAPVQPNARGASAQPVTNYYQSLMPFPRGLLFPPGRTKSISETITKTQGRSNCDPTKSTNVVGPEPLRRDVYFYNACSGTPKRVPVPGMPGGLRTTPDGKTVLVGLLDKGQIAFIDVASKTVTGTITLPTYNGSLAQPNDIAILPDGSRAYISDHVALPESTVYVLDIPSQTVVAMVPTGAFPVGLHATPDGSQVWVPSRGDGTCTIIDTMTNTVVMTLQNIPEATAVAFNPTGTRAYVSAGIESNGYVNVYDTALYSQTNQIPVGDLPHAIRVTPGGRFIFVTNLGSSNVTIISTTLETVVKTFNTLHPHPSGLVFVKRYRATM
jgi:DNA-binding beta-propeller fold protein YncE